MKGEMKGTRAMETNTPKKCSENILKALELSKAMLALAEDGDTWRQDEGCGVLFGVIRDSAYKIQALATSEMRKHQDSGRWDPSPDSPVIPGRL